MQLLFLNGFDRCGSSMIGGLLAKHPDVAYFFQPFNRTEVHQTQYELWAAEQRFPETERFLRGLLEGRVHAEFLGADLFEKFSTAKAPRANALNVVKETKLHFKAAWLQARFPGIALHGMWRDPRGILCSLLRNGFGDGWYGERAFHAISKAIQSTPALSPYRSFLGQPLEDYEKLALVIAARTHVFCQDIAADNWVIYEEVLENAGAVLSSLIRPFGLAPYDFSQHLAHDFNVVGEPSRGSELWRTYFTRTQGQRLDAIFGELEAIGPRAGRNFAARFAAR